MPADRAFSRLSAPRSAKRSISSAAMMKSSRSSRSSPPVGCLPLCWTSLSSADLILSSPSITDLTASMKARRSSLKAAGLLSPESRASGSASLSEDMLADPPRVGVPSRSAESEGTGRPGRWTMVNRRGGSESRSLSSSSVTTGHTSASSFVEDLQKEHKRADVSKTSAKFAEARRERKHT